MITRRHVLGSMTSGVALAGLGALPAEAATPLSVAATTGMIADTAATLAGEFAVVRGLMGPGVDPHAYRQTRTDIAALIRADLVLWHGLYLEAQMQDFMRDLARKRTVVAVGEAVPVEYRIAHPTYTGEFDPHVWMDPMLWRYPSAAIAEALVSARPEIAEQIGAHAETFDAALVDLDTYARGVLETVPAESRVLLTAHDAFGYFGRAYGFEVIGIQGISTESEAGLQRIAELVDLLVERQIGAVFVESSVSERNILALIEGAAAQGHKVRVGGELFSDAMGRADTYEGTYLGMIDHNVTTIAAALGGAAPQGGMVGRLGMEG